MNMRLRSAWEMVPLHHRTFRSRRVSWRSTLFVKSSWAAAAAILGTFVDRSNFSEFKSAFNRDYVCPDFIKQYRTCRGSVMICSCHLDIRHIRYRLNSFLLTQFLNPIFPNFGFGQNAFGILRSCGHGGPCMDQFKKTFNPVLFLNLPRYRI